MDRENFFEQQFVVIAGFQRCGTTSLGNFIHDNFEVLPSIWRNREPRIFIENRKIYPRTLDRYFGSRWREQPRTPLLEKSTTYSESIVAPERIKSFSRSAKVIFSLRSPLQRAISNYGFSVKHGLERRSIFRAFSDEASGKLPPKPSGISTNPYRYLGRGLYSEYLSNWLRVFPRSQILILVMEHVVEDQTFVLEELKKIGLTPKGDGKTMSAANVGSKNPFLSATDHRNLAQTFGWYFEESNASLEAMGINIEKWRLLEG